MRATLHLPAPSAHNTCTRPPFSGLQDVTNNGGQIFTSSPARHIDQKSDSVDVYSDQRVVTGKYVVVATPPHLSGRITYTPPLPGRRAQLTQRMPMGTTVKCLAFYDSPFWRKGAQGGSVIALVSSCPAWRQQTAPWSGSLLH